MTTHQLITLTTPPTRVLAPIGGYLPQRTVAPGQEITAPEGHAYVPILPQTQFNPSTHRIERSTTLEADGWMQIPLTPEEIAAMNPPPEIPKLTPRQLRLGLLNAKGITPETIENMLAGNTAALIEWNFATYTERTHPMVAMLGTQLNMTEEDIDNFFLYAATL